MRRKNKVGKFLSKVVNAAKEASKYVRINDPYQVKRAVSMVKGIKNDGVSKKRMGIKSQVGRMIKGLKRTILK